MIAIALKATAVLIAAFCVTASLGRRSAALRHFVWTLAFAALLALPAARLPLATRPLAAPGIFVSAVTIAVPASPSPAPSTPWLAILYGAGALLAAGRFLIGGLRASRMARHGAPSTLGREFGVRVVLSWETPMPLAWGILRPVVLLPATAAGWPAALLRSVLLHESMHHRRRDLLTQAIAQAACCLFWCHPLAWLALARQRAERENACDDAVLRQGVAPHEYATHLIEVVRTIAAGRSWSDAPAMAESSGIESRVRSVLNRDADRRPLSRWNALAVSVAAIVLLAGVGAVNLRAQPARGTLTGVVEDPSGARVPNCRVTARNFDSGNQEVTRADAAGQYSFAIPPGHYTVEFGAPGFATAKVTADLVAGATARVDGRLEIGHVLETVAVSGRRSSPTVTPQTAPAPQRIRVGGSVQAMRLIRQPRPVYPPELQQLGVEGTVVMQAVISKAGAVLNPKVVNTVDPRLAQAALDAVSHWQYQPTLLNGEPVETLTTISLEFKLDQ